MALFLSDGTTKRSAIVYTTLLESRLKGPTCSSYHLYGFILDTLAGVISLKLNSNKDRIRGLHLQRLRHPDARRVSTDKPNIRDLDVVFERSRCETPLQSVPKIAVDLGIYRRRLSNEASLAIGGLRYTVALDGMGRSCHLYAEAPFLNDAAQWLWLLGRWEYLMHHRGPSGGGSSIHKDNQPLELGPALQATTESLRME